MPSGIRAVSEAPLASFWLRFNLLGLFSFEISLNCCENTQVRPAPVLKHHLPFIIGLKLLLINGIASALLTTSSILSTSLQANLMQVCYIKLMIVGSARISFGSIDSSLLLVLVVSFRLSLLVKQMSLELFLCWCGFIVYIFGTFRPSIYSRQF